MSKPNTKIPVQSLVDSASLLPPPENPPANGSPANRSPEWQSPENRSPEWQSPDNRSPEKPSPPPRAVAHHPVPEVTALPPPPQHPIDKRSDREKVPESPVVAVVLEELGPATKPEGGTEGGGGGGRSRQEEVPAVVVNRSSRKESAAVTKLEDGGGRGYQLPSVLRRSKREAVVRKAALGFRVLGVIFCLISFSIMAADKTQGWAGDSFDRYKEYRYCLTITVIGFVYSGFQAFSQAQLLITGKQFIHPTTSCYFDFFMDQILAYLLMSASSSAATRTEDWVLNWGKDDFTKMASASIGMSFLAFFAFAFSALISGYILCNRSS